LDFSSEFLGQCSFGTAKDTTDWTHQNTNIQPPLLGLLFRESNWTLTNITYLNPSPFSTTRLKLITILNHQTQAYHQPQSLD
jgi:hypothetical protein